MNVTDETERGKRSATEGADLQRVNFAKGIYGKRGICWKQCSALEIAGALMPRVPREARGICRNPEAGGIAGVGVSFLYTHCVFSDTILSALRWLKRVSRFFVLALYWVWLIHLMCMLSPPPPRPTQLIAFYLPQFHPIPENDTWWGKGFTEWTNVTRGKPLFRGQEQPRLPADLGFYDLRLPETRAAQAALAREYGIGAFCYYHYWFNGRRVLERPFNDVLRSGEPDFPFCLCWANEDWTRSWDGQSGQVLLQQIYSAEDDRAHFEALLPAFKDPRYLRRDGKPVFLIYRAKHLPDTANSLARWQEMARANGLPGICFLRVESFPDERNDPRPLGFEAAVEFQPEWRQLGDPRWKRGRRKLMRKLGLRWPGRWRHTIVPYERVVEIATTKPKPDYVRFPGVAPSWDNSARRQWSGLIVTGSEPAKYERWLRSIIVNQKHEYVFVNAWNEWAEGCHLEPHAQRGRAYLEATRRAVDGG